MTETGDWIRLYPIDYRYRPGEQHFRKYQWIEIGLANRGDGNDKRKESRKPNLDSIKLLGEPLTTKDSWSARRAIIDQMPHRTLKDWQTQYEIDKTSLGIVRPTRVLDVKIEEADREWKSEWQGLFDQLRLFGTPQKPLRKIPYKFSYVFECEDSDKPHNAMIEDWELGVLFLNETKRLGSEEKAAESVKHKFFNDLCAPTKDTRFFMGTIFPFNSWVVLGVFYPPKLQGENPKPSQLSLF